MIIYCGINESNSQMRGDLSWALENIKNVADEKIG